jgi:hypothetical protein
LTSTTDTKRVLDNQDLAAAIMRLEKGYGLLVK